MLTAPGISPVVDVATGKAAEMLDLLQTASKERRRQRLQLLAFVHHPGHRHRAGNSEAGVEFHIGAAYAHHIDQWATLHWRIVPQRRVIQRTFGSGLQYRLALLGVISQSLELPLGDRGHWMIDGKRLPGVPLRRQILPWPSEQ